MYKNIHPELNNIKITTSQWDILLLYKLNRISKYNHLITIYYNFHHSLYNSVQQYCQKFTILIAELRDINLEFIFKN